MRTREKVEKQLTLRFLEMLFAVAMFLWSRQESKNQQKNKLILKFV